MNPRAAINDLLPFQGSPFNHLGTSACVPMPECKILFSFARSFSNVLCYFTQRSVFCQALYVNLRNYF